MANKKAQIGWGILIVLGLLFLATRDFEELPLFATVAGQACVDSDGFQPGVKGFVNDGFGDVVDFCLNRFQVLEMTCAQGKRKASIYDCTSPGALNECIDGRCDVTIGLGTEARCSTDNDCIRLEEQVLENFGWGEGRLPSNVRYSGVNFCAPPYHTDVYRPTRKTECINNICEDSTGTDFITKCDNGCIDGICKAEDRCSEGQIRNQQCKFGNAKFEKCINSQWHTVEKFCSSNEVCSDGNCIIDRTKQCFDECREFDKRGEHGANAFEICRDADRDGCTEWIAQACPRGELYSKGENKCTSVCETLSKCTSIKDGIELLIPESTFPPCIREESIQLCPDNHICVEDEFEGPRCINKAEIVPTDFDCSVTAEYELDFVSEEKIEITPFAITTKGGTTRDVFKARYYRTIIQDCSDPEVEFLIEKAGFGTKRIRLPLIAEGRIIQARPSFCVGKKMPVIIDVTARFKEEGDYSLIPLLRCDKNLINPREQLDDDIIFNIEEPEVPPIIKFFLDLFRTRSPPRIFDDAGDPLTPENPLDMSEGTSLIMTVIYDTGFDKDVLVLDYNDIEINRIQVFNLEGNPIPEVPVPIASAPMRAGNQEIGFKISKDISEYQILIEAHPREDPQDDIGLKIYDVQFLGLRENKLYEDRIYIR